MSDAADDTQIRIEPPSVDCQIDIHSVMVSYQNNRRRFAQAGFHQHLAVGCIADKSTLGDIVEFGAHAFVALQQMNRDIFLLSPRAVA